MYSRNICQQKLRYECTELKKEYLYSPLIGSFITSLFIGLYNIYEFPDHLSAIHGLIKFFPTIWLSFFLIFLVITTPINIYLFKKFQRDFLELSHFRFYGLIIYSTFTLILFIVWLVIYGFTFKVLTYSLSFLAGLYFTSSLFISIYDFQHNNLKVKNNE